jgi:hypothetical protein
MPSYGSSVDSSAKPKADDGVPSFGNPFGDFDFNKGTPKSEDTPSAPVVDKEAEKAAAVATKVDEKAAKEAAVEAKRVEKEEAEGRKKEAEAAAEAKKAEKEARRQSELEKQKMAVERAKEQAAKEQTSAPAPVSISFLQFVWCFVQELVCSSSCLLSD